MSKPDSRFRGTLVLLVALCCAGSLRAAEVIPPKPTRYFNDAAGIVSPAVAAQLNQRLEQFERDTSNQILVAIYPRLQSDSSVEDYTVRVAQAWGVGQKGRNNGAVLFAFMQEHQLRIQVGYGLEAVLPDGLCHLIVENELKPRFRAGDYAGGLDAAVTAIIAATRGEYHGTGRTSDDGRSNVGWPVILAGLVLFVVFGYVSRYRRSAVYQSSTGRRGSPFWFGGGG
ncbi:MAG TPA: TPM domain-containing protein, partial [Opitutaceae bacterium]|nr:TPM domain-containing protein [Opitutaceae bacterium]